MEAGLRYRALTLKTRVNLVVLLMGQCQYLILCFTRSSVLRGWGWGEYDC